MGDPPKTDETSVDDATTGPPRWVKVFGVVAVLVLLLFVVLLVAGRGEHGPGRHGSSGGSSTAYGDVPPAV